VLDLQNPRATFEVYSSPKNVVTLDFETQVRKGYGQAMHPENDLLMACYKVGDGPIHEIWGNEFDLGYSILLGALDAADVIIAHNAKYELAWLRRLGFDISKCLVFDTKIAEYVLMGNLAAGDKLVRGRSTSLDACCRRRGLRPKDPVVDKWMKHGISPEYMPRPWVAERCRRDVDTTYSLYKDQHKSLMDTGRLQLLMTRCLLTPILADMEETGVCLDHDRVVAEYEYYSRQLAQLQKEFDDTHGINWRSPKQAAEYLYGPGGLGFKELTRRDGSPIRSPRGQPLTSKEVMLKLKPKTAKQKEFIRLRRELGKAGAAVSKNLDFFYGVVTETDGVFKAEYNQTTTATHRLSSNGVPTKFEAFDQEKSVQLQNSPRIFKRLYKARHEGWKVGEADGAQLEFRVAGELGNDKQIRQDLADKRDVHSYTAEILTAAGQPTDRQDAKSRTFKPLYGGKSGTKAEVAYFKAFAERYSDLACAQRQWVGEVTRTKQLRTPWGMIFFWPHLRIGRDGYVNVERAIYNYPIQCLATAEIIPIALIYMYHRIKEMGLQDKILLVNTIHDSIITELAPGMEGTFHQLAKQCFGEDVYRYLAQVYNMKFQTTLGCGVKIGTHWGEGDESNYDLEVA